MDRGEVLDNISLFFMADKLKSTNGKKMHRQPVPKQININRRTTKTTKSPVRFRGWMGGR